MEAKKRNVGCSNCKVNGWINVHKSPPHVIVTKFPILRFILFKNGILSKERYKEHLEGKFSNIK